MKYGYLENDNNADEEILLIVENRNQNRYQNDIDNMNKFGSKNQEKCFKTFRKPCSTGIFPEAVLRIPEFDAMAENSEENVSPKFQLDNGNLIAHEKEERNGIFPFFHSMSQHDEERNYFIENQRPRWSRENEEEVPSSIFPSKEHSIHQNIVRNSQNSGNNVSDRNNSFYNQSSCKFNNIAMNTSFLDTINCYRELDNNDICKNDENQIGRGNFLKPSFSIMNTPSQNFSRRGLWT